MHFFSLAYLISHRMLIQGANRIFVIEKGRVVEEGVHGDLMQKKGVCYKLNAAQIHNVA